MATTSPLQSVPLPEATDADNVPYDLGNAVNFLEKRLVMRFASATARDTALPTPELGMLAFLLDTETTWQAVSKSASIVWAPVPGTSVLAIRQTTGQSVAGDGSASALTFQAEDLDLLGSWTSGSPSRFTATVPGRYEMSGGVAYPSNATGYRGLYWRVSGTIVNASGVLLPAASGVTTAIAARTVTVYLNGTTDYVELVTLQNSASTLTTAVTTYQQAHMNATYKGKA